MSQDEFADLVLGHLDEVASFLRRRTSTAADADDLAQETFARAFRSWRQLRDRGGCRAWLFRIARNLLAERRRRLEAGLGPRLVHLEDLPHEPPTISAESVERLDSRELEEALGGLPEEQSEALLLCDVWGFTYEEIAAITASPVGTVRSRIARGRRRLAGLLGAARPSRGRRAP